MIIMSKVALFTMDVESFYDTDCIRKLNLKQTEDHFDGLDNYLKLLKKYNIKSTLFVVSSIINKIKEKLKDALNEGHEIALHTKNHEIPTLKSNEEFNQEIIDAKKEIFDSLNINVEGFRSPCFAINNEKLEILKNNGFKYDSSYLNFNKKNYHEDLDLSLFRKINSSVYNYESFYEFEMSSINNFPICGGGYIRIPPFIFTKGLIKKYIKNNDVFIFYLHPFELSNTSKHRINKLNSLDKYYLKVNKKSFIRKIDKIIKMLKKEGFEFKTYQQYINEHEKTID